MLQNFIVRVLHGLSWCDVVPSHAGLISPAQNSVAGQLGAIVADNRLGLATRGDHKIEFAATRRPDNEIARMRNLRPLAS